MTKANSFLCDTRGDMDMMQTVVMLIVLLSVLYIGISILDGIETSTALPANVDASGTLTASGNVTALDEVVIGTETYVFTVTDTGAFNVVIGATANNTTAITNLVAEIIANSTLVTAVDNTNSTTITSVLAGTTGNAYATTETGTNLTFGAATLTGGVDGSAFYDSSTALTTSAEGAYDMAGLLPTVLIATGILGALLGIMYRFG